MTKTAVQDVASACVFCQIIAGERDAWAVHETAESLVFLDRRPLFPGHCLVVPRAHVETLDDLPDPLVGPFFSEVRLISRAVQHALEAAGSFVAANNRVSQSVPHLHVHVVPRNPKDGLRGFFWPRNPYESQEQAQEIRDRLQRSVQELLQG